MQGGEGGREGRGICGWFFRVRERIGANKEGGQMLHLHFSFGVLME